MNVTPLDIQQKRFHMSFRGYNRNEVDSFLDLVREEMEALVREVTELREFHQTYDQRMNELNEREETIKSTMIMTQKLADEQKENARKEAALIIKDTEIRSQQIINNTQQEKVKLESDIHELRRRKHHFMQDIKKVIQMHLEMVRFEGGNENPDEQASE
jgi:cell division initiation protein